MRILLKRHILKDASAITATTEPETKIIETEFKKPTFHLPSGFDEQEYTSDAHKRSESKKFIIVHTGILNNLTRNPINLLHAIKNLKEKGLINENTFELRFVGIDSYLLEDKIQIYRITRLSTPIVS